MNRLAALAVLLVLGLPLLPGTFPCAWAQETQQVRLTAADVEGFLASRSELAALSADFARLYGDRSEDAGADPVTALPAYQDIPAARTRTTGALHRFGFPDLAHWMQVSESVLTAAAYLDPANPPPDVEGDKRKAQAEIAADANLTPEQRNAALQQVDAQFAPLFDTVPLPGNVAVVRPFSSRVRALTGAD